MKRIVVFAFFIFSFAVFGEILPLKGERRDFLVDFEKKKFFCGQTEGDFSFPLSKGYFFVYEESLFCFDGENLIDSSDSVELSVQNTLLPGKPVFPYSIQHFCRDGFLFVPVEKGFEVFNIEKGKKVGELKTAFKKTKDEIVFPDIFVSKDFVFLKYPSKVEVFKNFEKVKTYYPSPNSLRFYFSCGSSHFSMLTVEKPGGAFSIYTKIVSYNLKLEKIFEEKRDCFATHVFPVFGDFLYEKKDISIFSLFGGKKISFERVFAKKNKIKKFSFTLSHKRRHLYPVYYGKKIYIVAQCKDGKVFLLDFSRKKKKELDKRFYYDYVFLKGDRGGVFYNPKKDNYSVVDFDFGFFARLF